MLGYSNFMELDTSTRVVAYVSNSHALRVIQNNSKDWVVIVVFDIVIVVSNRYVTILGTG